MWGHFYFVVTYFVLTHPSWHLFQNPVLIILYYAALFRLLSFSGSCSILTWWYSGIKRSTLIPFRFFLHFHKQKYLWHYCIFLPFWSYQRDIDFSFLFLIALQGYKMDDLLTSYISQMLTNMNKQHVRWADGQECSTIGQGPSTWLTFS